MSNTDLRTLRDAFGAFLTGVTVVTTIDKSGSPRGFTANSFTSVSLDPPLLLVCLAKSSSGLATFQSAERFAVNILSEEQEEVSRTFAKPVEDRFAAVNWRPGPYGSPVFDGASAWFDCAVHDCVDAGDHLILVGRVEAFENGIANGLGYARGSYFTLGRERQAATAVSDERAVVVSAVVARDSQILLFSDAAGNLALPTTKTDAKRGAISNLTQLIDETGLPATIGFIYSVYEARATRSEHIVYHCIAGNGALRKGMFFDLDELPFDKVADPATRALLKRFADESRIGQFGVYLGDEEKGDVHRPTSGE